MPRLARVALVIVSAPLLAGAQVTVGRSAQVSVDRALAAHTEYFASADPGNSLALAACSMMVDPSHSRITAALYLSNDGGRTWRISVDDTTSRYGNTWDPACALAPGGVVLLATLPTKVDPTGPQPGEVTRFNRSTDGGKTWAPPFYGVWVDNGNYGVDWTDGPYRGRVYLVGIRLSDSVASHLALLYSTDSGRTYQGPVTSFPTKGSDQGNHGVPVVLPDGRVMVPVVFRRSAAVGPTTDSPSLPSKPAVDSIPAQAVAIVPILEGGARFGAPARVAEVAACRDPRIGPPVFAVDRSSSPFRNRMYVVFADGAQGRCQIMLSWSDDGTRWSSPLPVDDPAVPTDPGVGPDAFLPQVAVNNRGVVGITWYDRREDPANRTFRQRFSASADGGASVLRSVAVSTHPHSYANASGREPYFAIGGRSRRDPSGALWLGVVTGRAYRTYDEVGDFGGLAVRADGVFQPFWVDNRTGVPQLFTAPVHVSAAVMRADDRDAKLGRPVSDSVTLVVTRSTFHSATCHFDIAIDLINRASRPLALPLVVRIDQMLSQMGIPRTTGGNVDDLGRPVWRLGATGELTSGATVSHSARVTIDECRALNAGASGTYRRRVDARFNGNPTASVAGPKLLALKTRVFEPVTR